MSFELHPDLQRDGISLGQFSLCQVLLINDSNYPWFVLVPQREGIRDTIDLEATDYQTLWEESARLGRCIMELYDGDKLNVAALGNVTPQLHVHHIVRFKTDPAWPSPIWGKFPMNPYPPEQIRKIREQLGSLLFEQRP